jgi:hypothetical protein
MALGAAGVASGVSLIGLGGWALSLNGDCVDPPVGMLMACPSLYSTTAVGASLLASGIALGIGGAVLLGVPGPRRKVPVPVRAASSQPQGTSLAMER